MKLLSLSLAFVIMLLAPSIARADHPAYLHALSDLRMARAMLARPSRDADVRWDENKAIREIDAAIKEIRDASIDDGKRLDEHPPVDTALRHRDRLRNAMALLKQSAADIEQREDNRWARGMRNRAIAHIRNAETAVRDAIEDRANAEPPPPPPPPAHPAYLHALSDLRYARFLLNRPSRDADVKWDENKAVREIDAAIKEIRDAAIDDGKPLDDHPPVDGGMRHRDRLRTAMNLLKQSAADIEQREDNAWARGLRDRAIGHIRGAERAVRDAIEDRADSRPPPPPPEHPAYLHALSDLRFARAMLARPTRDSDVRWDENKAIREIDAAIREIREAAIDDNKPIDDHPPIDAGLRHRDRLRNAMNLLTQAAADIEQREDNAWARGLRNRAVGHIRGAERAVRDAIEDRRR